MRVLILGAAGKLGRRVAAVMLASEEHQVTLFVRSDDKLRRAVPHETLAKAQVCFKAQALTYVAQNVCPLQKQDGTTSATCTESILQICWRF